MIINQSWIKNIILNYLKINYNTKKAWHPTGTHRPYKNHATLLLNDLLKMRKLAVFVDAFQHYPQLPRNIIVEKFNTYFLIVLIC